jgi:hypothetical protein
MKLGIEFNLILFFTHFKELHYMKHENKDLSTQELPYREASGCLDRRETIINVK